MEVIGLDEDGVEPRSEVLEMERRQLAMESLGMSLADGKAILQGVQEFVTAQQVSADLRRRRNCPNGAERYHSKKPERHRKLGLGPGGGAPSTLAPMLLPD